jgi:hypothetical protein
MRLLVSRSWQETVKRFELRPGSVTEWCVGRIMERLIEMTEKKRQRVYVQTAIVKQVEERFTTKCVSGFGKDAKTEEVSDGWWITFVDSKTAVRCDNKPDVEVGDRATCTWEFSRP